MMGTELLHPDHNPRDAFLNVYDPTQILDANEMTFLTVLYKRGWSVMLVIEWLGRWRRRRFDNENLTLRLLAAGAKK